MITAFQPNAFQVNGFQIQANTQINGVLLATEDADTLVAVGRVQKVQYRFATATLRTNGHLCAVEGPDTVKASGHVQLAVRATIVETSDLLKAKAKTLIQTRISLRERQDGCILIGNSILSAGLGFMEPADRIIFSLNYSRRNRLREEEEFIKILLAA